MDRVSSIIFQKEELKKDALLLLHSSFALCESCSFLSKTQSGVVAA